MDEDFELDALLQRRSRRAWIVGALCLVLVFAYLPLGWATGSARFFTGPRMIFTGPGKIFALYFPAFALGVYAVLLSPLLRSGFLKPEQNPGRLVAALSLWGLPLLSFAYWLGDFKGALHAYDLSIFIFAALTIPLALYWRTGSERVLAVAVALIAFVPLFVVEDILGPFSPLWVYASEGPGFYNLRTLCVAFALGLACTAPVPQIGRVRFRETVFRMGVVTLATVSMVINVGDWWLGAKFPTWEPGDFQHGSHTRSVSDDS
jgi:hypothetical protein